MATMVHDEQTGERTFHVAFDDSIPGGPFHGRAELQITTQQPDDHPTQLALRFFPTEFEFQVKLERLISEGGFQVYPPELSRAAREAQAVVVYEADAELLALLPAGLNALPVLEALLIKTPALFNMSRYKLTEICFED